MSEWRHYEYSEGFTVLREPDEDWAAAHGLRYMREPFLRRAWRILQGHPRPLTSPAMVALLRSRFEAAAASMAASLFSGPSGGGLLFGDLDE